LLLSGCLVGDPTPLDPGGDPADPENPDPADPENPEPETPTGSLRITATTTTKGGVYAPNNVVAVWVENDQGAIVKTIDRWSSVRTQYLLEWNTAAGAGDVDSVSGASRTSHTTPLTIQWKLKGRDQQVIPDGTYTIRMESTESNATSIADTNEGTFTFTKGAAPESQTGLSNGGFTNVSIDFTPPP
jgi:hypothetical protein